MRSPAASEPVAWARVYRARDPRVQLPWEWQTHNTSYFDPSGQHIVYARHNALGQTGPKVTEATILYDLASGQARELPPPDMHFVRFSHDGRWLAGSRHDGSAVICNPDGLECRAVGRGTGTTPVQWSADDSRLFYLRVAGRQRGIGSVVGRNRWPGRQKRA